MDKHLTTIGQLVDKLWAKREMKRKLEEEKMKPLEKEIAQLQEDIMDRMGQQELEGGRGRKASASITEEVVANITDFEALCKYVKRTGYFHLFHRRISNPAFRELAAKKPVPGLEAFTKKKLNLTTLKKGV